VKVRDAVVADDVSGAVQPHRRVRFHHRREFLSLHVLELLPERAGPPCQVARIIPADELAVGHVEIARRTVSPFAPAMACVPAQMAMPVLRKVILDARTPARCGVAACSARRG